MKTIKLKDGNGKLIYVDVSNLTLNDLIELRKELIGYSAYAVLTSMINDECMQSTYTKKYNHTIKNKRKINKRYRERI